MTLVRQQAFGQQQVREDQKADPRTGGHGEEGSQVIAHLGNPQPLDAGSQEGKGKKGQQQSSDSMVNALAYQIANLDQKGIDRAVKNLSRISKANAIPTDNPLATMGPHGLAAVYQRGSLRRLMYSQPLPGMLGAKQLKNPCGLFVSPQLRKKLERFLKGRPKKGFGYIIAKGDLLDDLLEEAYEDFDEESRAEAYIAAFLEYNRHLGLSGPEALSAAVGQLLFFPEMQEVLKLQEIIERGLTPENYPAIEAFLEVAGLPDTAARMFHWVPPRLPASDANLTTAGKPFAFSSAGYSATSPFNAGASDIPEQWVAQGMSPEMHNARLNSDKPYMRNLLATGRYNHIRV